jgi:hypothetical protein
MEKDKVIELCFSKQDIDNINKELQKSDLKKPICINSHTWNKLRIEEYNSNE